MQRLLAPMCAPAKNLDRSFRDDVEAFGPIAGAKEHPTVREFPKEGMPGQFEKIFLANLGKNGGFPQ
jgi:hypothetical protein